MNNSKKTSARIIPYDSTYRDDMIFMVLLTKDALGRVPRLNPDLLDIPGYYLKEGDPFWLALDEGKRVIPLREPQRSASAPAREARPEAAGDRDPVSCGGGACGCLGKNGGLGPLGWGGLF